MGQPLDGSFQALHSIEWGLYWHKQRGLILEQKQGGVWVEVAPGQAFPELTRTTRHIGLAFDQSARHVVCWEDSGQILVRQWNPLTQEYTYRGPFSGVDPLVWNDTTASYYPPDSDVVLLYLTPDRTEARYRLQRDAYGVSYPLSSGLSGAVLDQPVSLPFGAQIRGENGEADWTLDLGLYPLRGADALGGAARLIGLYEEIVRLAGSEDQTTGTSGVSGLWESTTEIRSSIDATTGTAALSGAYESTVVTQSMLDPTTGASALGGTYVQTAFPYATTDSTTGGAALSGTYGP